MHSWNTYFFYFIFLISHSLVVIPVFLCCFFFVMVFLFGLVWFFICWFWLLQFHCLVFVFVLFCFVLFCFLGTFPEFSHRRKRVQRRHASTFSRWLPFGKCCLDKIPNKHYLVQPVSIQLGIWKEKHSYMSDCQIDLLTLRVFHS